MSPVAPGIDIDAIEPGDSVFYRCPVCERSYEHIWQQGGQAYFGTPRCYMHPRPVLQVLVRHRRNSKPGMNEKLPRLGVAEQLV